MIYLTSSVASVSEHLYENYLKELNLKTVAFIDTAAEPERGGEDMQWLADDRQSWIDRGYEVADYTFTNKTTEEIEVDLREFDIIYMSGGNTYYLLQQVQKSGAADILRSLVESGKVYVGTSAGSIIAGPDILPSQKIESVGDAPDLKGTIGLGLVDFVVLPHWGSEYFKDAYLDYNMKHIYNDSQQKIILLNDHQYIVVREGGDIKITDNRVD